MENVLHLDCTFWKSHDFCRIMIEIKELGDVVIFVLEDWADTSYFLENTSYFLEDSYFLFLS